MDDRGLAALLVARLGDASMAAWVSEKPRPTIPAGVRGLLGQEGLETHVHGRTVTITRTLEARGLQHAGGTTMNDRQKQAAARYLGWYIVTGNREDTVTTERLRQDWYLAHSDLGLPCPKGKRGAGVTLLLDSSPGVTRGRGLLRGVVPSDDAYDEALALLDGAGWVAC